MYLKVMSLILIAFALLSCSSGADETQATLTIVKNKAYLIDAKGQSCKNKKNGVTDSDVTSRYFTLSGSSIKWTSTSSYLTIAYFKITVESPYISGGKYTKVVDSDELAALSGNISCPWDNQGRAICPSSMDNYYQGPGYLKAADSSASPTVLNLDCPFRFGGLGLAQDTPFTATGFIEMVGFAVDNSTQDQIPVKATATVTIQNM